MNESYRYGVYTRVKDTYEELKHICYKQAKELYSNDLEPVFGRIDSELNAMDNNAISGILQLRELFCECAIKPSYISMRGTSVASFVLYLCGISNINSVEFKLPPDFAVDKENLLCIDINVPDVYFKKLLERCDLGQSTGSDKADFEVIFHSHKENQFLFNLSQRLCLGDISNYYNDPDLIRLFSSTDSLDAKNESTQGILPQRKGSGLLGLQEFRYISFLKMLDTVNVNSFSDVIKLTALTHGTETWFGNAQALLVNGVAGLDDVISSREDLFVSLMVKGMDRTEAYRIARQVSMGKGLTIDDEKLLISLEMPEWFIKSCKTVKYVFTKAQALSYVTNAFKLAYYKVYYTDIFYEEYFKLYAPELVPILDKGNEEFSVYAQKIIRDYKAGEDIVEAYYNVLVAMEMLTRYYRH